MCHPPLLAEVDVCEDADRLVLLGGTQRLLSELPLQGSSPYHGATFDEIVPPSKGSR